MGDGGRGVGGLLVHDLTSCSFITLPEGGVR